MRTPQNKNKKKNAQKKIKKRLDYNRKKYR